MRQWFKAVSADFFKWTTIVVVSYISIQLINQYERLFAWTNGILSALSPFLLAFLIAYLLNPIMKQFEKRLKWSRGKSVLATYLLILVGLGIFVGILGPMIYRNATELIKQIPTYATGMTQWVTQWDGKLNVLGFDLFDPLYDQLLKFIPQAMELLNNSLAGIVSLMMGIMTGTGNFILAFFVSIYVLLAKESFGLMSKKLSTLCFGIKNTNIFETTLRLLHVNIGHYLVGKLICSIFVGVCCVVGIVIFKGKYALLLGLIFGLTNMVPLFGPIVGTAIIFILHLFINPWTAFFLLIYLFVIQEIESLVIDPKFAGKKVGLTPFFTILGVILGGAIGGVIGMILGVPVLGVFKTLMVPWIEKTYEEKISPSSLGSNESEISSTIPITDASI